jgi:hypothetical protein
MSIDQQSDPLVTEGDFGVSDGGVLPVGSGILTLCPCRLGYTLIVELAEKQLRGKIVSSRLG